MRDNEPRPREVARQLLEAGVENRPTDGITDQVAPETAELAWQHARTSLEFIRFHALHARKKPTHTDRLPAALADQVNRYNAARRKPRGGRQTRR